MFAQAEWLWTKGRTRRPFHVSYFRRTFRLSRVPGRVRLGCCADSKYHLWVNGQYIGAGPARGCAEQPYFDTYDVGSLLRPGRNAVAFVVQHYTSGANIFSAVQGGLICQLDAEGVGVLAASDGGWRAKVAAGYRSMPGVLFPEVFDAREEPREWQKPDFDDSSWPKAKVLRRSKLASPGALVPRPIPPLTQTLCQPAKLLDAGTCGKKDGRAILKERQVARSLARCELESAPEKVFSPEVVLHTPWPSRPLTVKPPAKGKAVYLALEFGRNILAHPRLSLEGPASTVVDLGYSEVLDNNRVAPLHQGIPHSDRIILRQGRTDHRLLQPRGFRYMILRIANFRRPVKLLDLSACETIYPAKPRGTFECSDAALEDIYRLSARTVNLCMEDGYTDCPWRERSQWLGDIQPEALFSYYCFGSYDLARKMVREFARSNTAEGWIPGVFPITKPFNLPTWGMRYPVIAWQYYLFTGDRDTLEAAYAAVDKQMQWLARYEDRGGLLRNVPGWCFVDWTKTDATQADGAVQGWYVEALDHSARIAAALGRRDEAAGFRRRAIRSRKSIAKAYWSGSRRGFLKYAPRLGKRPDFAPPDLLGQHENFLFSLLGIGTARQRRQGLEAVRGATGKYLPNLGNYQSHFTLEQQGNVSSERTLLINTPFWSFYALSALAEAGEDRAMLDYIRICWGLMLDHGATSCWEMWDRNASLCHGWSGAPAMMLPAYVLGIQPTKPGFAEFEVCPRPVDLRWAKGEVPTPHGRIRVAWRIMPGRGRGKGKGKGADKAFLCTIQVPRGTTARFVPPGPCRRAGGKPVRLAAGKHELRFPMD